MTHHPERGDGVRTEPIVTVIIGAYNAMPYVTRTVQSVLDQSLGLENIELVAVNDGSTDGTGAELDRFAATWSGMRVVHQPNSGSPSAPRNLGLDLARGRFVFILDADDYLGSEALERMVAMAEDNGTDVVVGKMVGLGGRRAPSSMFGRDLPRTDVFSSRVYWTLSPTSSAGNGLGLPDGRWSVAVEFAEGGVTRTLSVPGFEDRARRWCRGLRPSHIKPRIAEDRGLLVVVNAVDPVRAPKRRLGRWTRSKR